MPLLNISPTVDRLAMALTEAGAAAAIRIIFQLTPDDELVDAWHQAKGTTGHAITDILAFEIERRGLSLSKADLPHRPNSN